MKSFLIYFVLLFACLFLDRDAHAQTPHCYGLYTDHIIDATFMQSTQDLLGKKPCVLMVYWDFVDEHFNTNLLQQIVAAGVVPMITLEPWDGQTKTGFQLSEIVTGKHDVLLTKIAQTIKDLQTPVLFRFAQEMNGDWYPWSGALTQHNATGYQAAYRYVHQFLNTHCDPAQIIWVWSVNATNHPNKAWNKPIQYYPGDSFVDVIGVDGYLSSKLFKTTGWGFADAIRDFLFNNVFSYGTSFETVFKKQLAELTKDFPKKRIILSETAAVLDQDRQYRWLTNYFKQLNQDYQQIPLIIWFDTNKEDDWRLTSNIATLEGFRKGLEIWFAHDDPRILVQELKTGVTSHEKTGSHSTP